MRYISFLFVLFLFACSPATTGAAQQVVELVTQNCGIIVSVADVSAALSASNPTVVGIDAVAHAICSQYTQKTSQNGVIWYVQDQQQQDTKNCAAVVNGVCIRKKDDQK